MRQRCAADLCYIREERAAFGRRFDFGIVQIAVPLVGIADLDAHAVQLASGARAGLSAHPVLLLNAPAVDVDKLADHFLDVRLGLGREIRLCIGAAQVIRQQTLHLLRGDGVIALSGVHAVIRQGKIAGRVQKFRLEARAHAVEQRPARNYL